MALGSTVTDGQGPKPLTRKRAWLAVWRGNLGAGLRSVRLVNDSLPFMPTMMESLTPPKSSTPAADAAGSAPSQPRLSASSQLSACSNCPGSCVGSAHYASTASMRLTLMLHPRRLWAAPEASDTLRMTTFAVPPSGRQSSEVRTMVPATGGRAHQHMCCVHTRQTQALSAAGRPLSGPPRARRPQHTSTVTRAPTATSPVQRNTCLLLAPGYG